MAQAESGPSVAPEGGQAVEIIPPSRPARAPASPRSRHATPLVPTTTQTDLFQGPLRGPVSGERNLMAYPFFSLDKRPRSRPMIYDDGKVRIEVRSAGDTGIATIWDAELIWYIASLMNEAIGKGEQPTKRFVITAADFMRMAWRNRSSRSYARIEGMLERLQGGQNKTTIEAGGKGYTGFFSWFTQAEIRWRRNSKGEQVMHAIHVELCDWLFHSIIQDRRILTIHDPKGYFSLSPIQRRLYEIARCHCTATPEFRIGLDELKKRVGVEMKLEKFKHLLKGVAESDEQRLHAYDLALVQDEVGAIANVARRDSLKHAIVVFTARSALTSTQAGALSASIEALAEDELVDDVHTTDAVT